MKKIIFGILTVGMIACKQQGNSIEEDGKEPPVTDENGYTVEKYGKGPETKSLAFITWDSTYKITVKHYTQGDYKIADTIGKHITLFREDFLDITVNDKTTTISKSLFGGLYPDKRYLYHARFGKVMVDKVDPALKTVTFKTFFGVHDSELDKKIIYNITREGKFEFVGVEDSGKK